MNTSQLSKDEKQLLLRLARQSIEAAVRGQPAAPPDPTGLPEALRQPGVCFVTLTSAGQLRGCIGALEAYQPLAEDVWEHAAAAAQEDYRFPPVAPAELSALVIEISRLTPLTPLDYASPADLLARLRPHLDGVMLREGWRRATFLPQVWEKLADPRKFLEHLCVKMGVEADAWQKRRLQVFTYQVEEFRESVPD
jgi:AmmeMemoRadiSam system protein A